MTPQPWQLAICFAWALAVSVSLAAGLVVRHDGQPQFAPDPDAAVNTCLVTWCKGSPDNPFCAGDHVFSWTELVRSPQTGGMSVPMVAAMTVEPEHVTGTLASFKKADLIPVVSGLPLR